MSKITKDRLLLFWQCLAVSFLTLASLAKTGQTQAQVTSDGTLGTQINRSTSLPCHGGICTITGGTTDITGRNLFHSFQNFSIPTGGEAHFDNSGNIQNIINRVTGISKSNIDGTISANGTANVFLINPNGIILSTNAKLNIGGSFVGTTANAMQFSNKGSFGVTTGNNVALLTINPSAFLFNQIANQSITSKATLQVQNGQSLLLVGGAVNLNGGNLLVPGGRVELGGLAGVGTVGLIVDNNHLRLNFPLQEVPFADISLTNGANVNVRSRDSGNISIYAQNFYMTGGSKLRAGISSRGSVDSQAGNIDIHTQATTTLSDANTFISNAILANSLGNGGDVNMTTRSLFVEKGAQIYTGTYSNSNSKQNYTGNVNIKVYGQASFDGIGSNGISSGAYNRVEDGSVGQGGNVNITAETLALTNGAVLQASSFGQGNAGSVNINVHDTASFDGFGSDLFSSGVYSRIEKAEAIGQTGGINLTAGSLFVMNGAVLTSSTDGQGNAGNININVRNHINLDGVGLFNPSLRFAQSSGVYSSVKKQGVGNGGNISITAESLSLSNGALVLANSFGQGTAGNIQVDADSVTLVGVGTNGQVSGLLTPTEPTAIGQAGTITVNSNILQIADGAVISSETRNSSPGGSININARTIQATNGGQILTSTTSGGIAGNIHLQADNVTLSGTDANFSTRPTPSNGDMVSNVGPPSGVFANTTLNSTGNGGNIFIDSFQLTIKDGAGVAVNNQGTGNGGKIDIQRGFLTIDNQGFISAATSSGEGGNIQILLDNLLVMRHNSYISATASGTGNGGNITINAPFIITFPQENNDVITRAIQGRGGNIHITTQGLFGFQSSDQLTPKSDISASSDFGINGNVEINTPDTDPSQGLAQLPTEVRVPQIAQGCTVGGGQVTNSFIVTGTGGLAPNPGEVLSSNRVLDDLGGSAAEKTVSSSTEATPLISANAMITDANGQISLVALLPTDCDGQ